MLIKLLRAIKRRIRLLTGLEILPKIKVSLPTEFHGTTYGGWAILGDSLKPDSVVYSFGVGEDASFDLAVITKYGCRVHAFDPTPKSTQWVAKNIHEPRFVFEPVALSERDGTLRLYMPIDPAHVSASLAVGTRTGTDFFDAPCQRLETIRKRLGHRRIDVLKMDIEGAEYSVLHDIFAASEEKPIQVLVEFHHWMAPFRVKDTRSALALLRSAGYEIAWVSDSGHEMLFIQRDSQR
jgi:FkbM family methyltransferase